jgi:hypothetical protein
LTIALKKGERERERGRTPNRQKDQFVYRGDRIRSKELNLAADEYYDNDFWI